MKRLWRNYWIGLDARFLWCAEAKTIPVCRYWSEENLFTTLISTVDLQENLDNPRWVVVDCRFSLNDPERGREDYTLAHIPGAIYAHLEEALSGPVIPGATGRHPLPAVETFVQTLTKWGICDGTQVVVYDDLGGAYAVRLWWMLRWLGFDAAAILDGGWPRWQQENRPERSGNEQRLPCQFSVRLRPDLQVSRDELDAMRLDPTCLVLDARSADRYRGENETIDPVAGHIPGAVSAPYADNLKPDGTFKSRGVLRSHYQRLLGDIPVERTVVYCGSGVSAVHDLLAMAYAGLGEARLYVGSWSDWITDPQRPVEK